VTIDCGEVQRRVALRVVVRGGRRLGGQEQLGLVTIADASGEVLEIGGEGG